jgi:hypothetical protein
MMMTDKPPKPGSALAEAVAALEAQGIGYTLNPSMETSITFVGLKGAAAAKKRKLSDPTSDSDEASRQPDRDR